MRFRARERAKIRAFERAARHPCAFRETLREPLDPNCAFLVLAERVGPNILSVAHWNRILGGELYARVSRPEWALLLARTFDVDVKRCARCGGRLKVRAVITEESTVAHMLACLGARALPAPTATIASPG